MGKAAVVLGPTRNLLLEEETIKPERTKLRKAGRAFGGYIATNYQFIPDSGERSRNAEPITPSVVESAVHQAVRKRLVQSQQMWWSQRGAQLWFPVPTHGLNPESHDRFHKWWPGMVGESEPEMRAAA
jgi:hypothetical protein